MWSLWSIREKLRLFDPALMLSEFTLMAAHSSDAEECLRDIPYPDELLCNKAFHENFICARQFSEFVMQNTWLTIGSYWHTSPCKSIFPALPKSSSSLHVCLPELFFHVTVARFINSLRLLCCWWIMSRPNTLQKLLNVAWECRKKEQGRAGPGWDVSRDLSWNQVAPSWHFISPVVTSLQSFL